METDDATARTPACASPSTSSTATSRDETVVLNLDTGMYHGLNRDGRGDARQRSARRDRSATRSTRWPSEFGQPRRRSSATCWRSCRALDRARPDRARCRRPRALTADAAPALRGFGLEIERVVPGARAAAGERAATGPQTRVDLVVARRRSTRDVGGERRTRVLEETFGDGREPARTIDFHPRARLPPLRPPLRPRADLARRRARAVRAARARAVELAALPGRPRSCRGRRCCAGASCSTPALSRSTGARSRWSGRPARARRRSLAHLS